VWRDCRSKTAGDVATLKPAASFRDKYRDVRRAVNFTLIERTNSADLRAPQALAMIAIHSYGALLESKRFSTAATAAAHRARKNFKPRGTN
jgi:hypothetical protein